jgi:drug/metabolite transporter (DMT)-like permease
MNKIVRGFLIILFAAFIWGIGNAITGNTAQKYAYTGSLFPAIDIALANTLGGLFFLGISLLISYITDRFTSTSNSQNYVGLIASYANKQSILSGALKGANTCLFVFSTTYIVATQSLIFESTYIFWSLLLSMLFLSRKVPLIATGLRTGILFVGVVLVSGQISLESGVSNQWGPIFGLFAGFSYALFLFFWSHTTNNLSGLKSQLAATSLLLTISLLTILLLTGCISLILFKSVWLPFSHLDLSDILLQTINGSFVVGLVYLLITIGMADLRSAREGSSFIAAFCLSFSIPFTLLPEYMLNKFIPTSLQLFGVFLFMIGFILMSVNLSKSQQNQ